jgi:hypothetical protein
MRAVGLRELKARLSFCNSSGRHEAKCPQYFCGRVHIAHLGRDIVERARRAFPVEPVRTLDALHLATALVLLEAVADLEMLSL